MQALELLRNGGAERMNYFSDYVTHLVCGYNAEETDVSDANDLYEIPAVTVKWVFISAALKQLVSVKPYIYNTKNLFSNLFFTFSKIRTDRNVLWSLITYYGGNVQLNLDSRVTHLVTIDTTSSKYIRSYTLGLIQIVTPDWITECIKSKSLLQAELYHPKLIIVPKTIKHQSTTSITGFEPEPSDNHEKTAEQNAADSTQALLDKLKQRMPWNQPQTSAIKGNIFFCFCIV